METDIILLFGQTGLGKNECGRKLAAQLLGLSLNKYPCAFLSLEDEIIAGSKSPNFSLHFYLSGYNLDKQRKEWKAAAERILSRIKSEKPLYCVLALHATYFFSSHFKTFVESEFIRELNPRVAFTLINDIYYIKDRIDKNPKNRAHRVNLTCKDILTWRSVECMVADSIVNNSGVNGLHNYIISTKQALKTYCDIIEKPDRKKAYLSFPITHIRDKESCRAIIDEVRFFLHKNFTCFDPLGIDEKRLFDEGEGKYVVKKCWPFGLDGCLCDENGGDGITTLEPEAGLENIGRIIDNHIVYRDYRLIDQSDCLIICRPFSSIVGIEGKKGLSPGVWNEVKYAQNVDKPVFLMDDIVTDPDSAESPFDNIQGVEYVTSFEELEAVLASLQT